MFRDPVRRTPHWPDDGLTGSSRVLVGLSRRFSNFPAAGLIVMI